MLFGRKYELNGSKSARSATVTGIKSPFSTTVTINWKQGTGKKLQDKTKITVHFILVGTAQSSSATNTAAKLFTDLDVTDTALHVLPDHPGIKSGLERSLLGSAPPFKRFPRAGAYTHEELGNIFAAQALEEHILGGDTIVISA